MGFRRIVIGVDFTDGSLAAARWLAGSFAPDAEIVVVHVVPEPLRPALGGTALRASEPQSGSGSGRPIEGALRGLAALLGRDRTRALWRSGNPPEVLARVATELDADLVCVGRGRRRRGSARFGAATATRLIARAHVPVLVAPNSAKGTPHRLLAAADDRPEGGRILQTAARLTRSLGAELEALHVIEPASHVVAGASHGGTSVRDRMLAAAWGPGDGAAGHDALARVRALDWLHSLLDELEPGTRGSAVVGSGDVGQEIVRRARQGGAELIVMGRGAEAPEPRRRGEVAPIGSTTRLVVWTTPAPVLVLPLDADRAALTVDERRDRHRRHASDVVPLHPRRAHRTDDLFAAAGRAWAGGEHPIRTGPLRGARRHRMDHQPTEQP